MQRDDSHFSDGEIGSTYLDSLHILGVLLSIGALIVGGLDNSRIGFPIAIGILISLSLGSIPVSDRQEVNNVIKGSLTTGGLKQGALIKGMFSTALLYGGIHPLLFGSGGVSVFELILGIALLLSSIATTLEAKTLESMIDASK
jgi:hypothetical protein